MTLGERIRRRRQEMGLTQNSLAQALGLTPQHISVIEQNKRVPSLASLGKMAQELGVTIDYLVTGKPSAVTGSIPAIKADDKLSLRSKRALVAIIQELYGWAEDQQKK